MSGAVWSQWLAVAVGGATGSVMRWRLGVWLNRPDAAISLGTLAVNCLGGLLIGASIVALQRVPGEGWRLLVVTGLLGGLTTFSAFSAESLGLLQRGQWGWALAHTLLHVAGGLGGAALGHALARQLLPAA